MLSICVPHSGRWRYFSRCAESVRASATAVGSFELVVADYPVGDPARDLPADFDGVVVRPAESFTRGGARNAAAAAAKGDILFFLDADMICVSRLFERAVEVAKSGRVFLPLYDFETLTGGYKHGNGTGNVCLSRSLWNKSVKFVEKEDWGGEDTQFAHQFKAAGLNVREKISGFIHQYHWRDNQ
jgi:glycosyltransferase involved in cell wall biosynthesis